jgi:hypothetical protein
MLHNLRNNRILCGVYILVLLVYCMCSVFSFFAVKCMLHINFNTNNNFMQTTHRADRQLCVNTVSNQI